MKEKNRKATVFYAWQSDLPNRTNRGFIGAVLEKVTAAIRDDDSILVEPVVDSDTQNVPGSPIIAETILAKIDSATVFVADVSIIGKTELDRPTPNPNILIELGYARKVLQPERLISIVNEAYGSVRDLPFDLKHRLVLRYNLREDASEDVRKATKRSLAAGLNNALRRIITMPPRAADIPPAKRSLEGARVLKDAAAAGLGPNGGRAVYRQDERSKTTRDGLEIARHYWSPDLFERHGMDRLNDVAEEVRSQAGDGSKTSMVLCYEMIRSGYEALEAGTALPSVLEGIEKTTRRVVDYLKQTSEPVDGGELADVAKSAGGAEVSKLLLNALAQAGDTGGMIIENEPIPAQSRIETQAGFWIREGYASPDFANDPASGNAILHDCLVMVCERKISSILEIHAVLNRVADARIPVAIVAEDFESEVIASLLENNDRGVLSSVAIKLPQQREHLRSYFKDLAITTGGRVLGGYFSPRFDSVQISDLGRAKTVVVTSESTQIIEGNADQKKLEIYKAQLKEAMQRASIYAASALRGRLANLIGNVTLIKVGGRTPTDLDDQRYRVETALASCRLAMASGFVLGGGLALFRAKLALEETADIGKSESDSAGLLIISRALEEPLKCLLRSAGLDVTSSLDKLTVADPNEGYNVTSGTLEDLKSAGIIDSTDVLIAAIEIASLQARTILQTSSWELLINPRHLPWMANPGA
jgi:chaperonin GroEL